MQSIHWWTLVAVIAYLQVKVRLNLHGVVGVESVQQVDEEEYEEKIKRPIAKVTPVSLAKNLCVLLDAEPVHICCLHALHFLQ